MNRLPLALRLAPLGALALVLAACSGPPDAAMEAAEEEASDDCAMIGDASGAADPQADAGDGGIGGDADGAGGGGEETRAGTDYANCGVGAVD